MADLIQPVPGGLTAYRPRLRYLLLDVARVAIPETGQNVAAALFRMEQSTGPDDMGQILTDLRTWLRPEQGDLQRAFVTVLEKRILPARMPGMEIPQIGDLEEAQLMLTERVNDWTLNWKREGFEEGRREEIEESRSILLSELEKRFGPLPEDVRHQVQTINSSRELAMLLVRVGTAPSLAVLGLTGENG